MKKIGSLPRAKIIPEELANKPQHYKEREKTPFGDMKIKLVPALIIIAVSLILMLINLKLTAFPFLIACTLAPFSDAGSLVIGGSEDDGYSTGMEIESTVYNRLPFFFAGLMIMSLMIANMCSGDDQAKETAIRMFLMKLLFFSIILAIVGKLVLFLSHRAAEMMRVDECKECVSVEPFIYTEGRDIPEDSVAYRTELRRCQIYRYSYGGKLYQFFVPKDLALDFRKNSEMKVYIDPKQPERYYSEWLIFTEQPDIVSAVIVTFMLLGLLAFAYVGGWWN